MLEDTRMDKKSLHRSSLQQSRATAVDCKKNSELTHKPWQRNNKKRETPGNAPKNENYRKNIPAQRGRGPADKRPHAHGANNFVVGGTPNTGLENDEEPQLGSLYVPGSKKQNLNHLLNFMYSPRGSNERRGLPPRRPQQNKFYHHFEHDLYLRTYCQFVVKQGGDFKENLTNPDLPVKWEEIEEIVVRRAGKWQCPICLGHPVAGRVGICGHVYCWACILHYSATHEKQPPPCPVCTVTLQVADMKPTRLVQWDTPEEVTMRLVRRLRGSAIVEVAPPRGVITEMKEASTLPLEEQPVSPYARIFSANHYQVLEILERDKREIEAQIQAEIDTTELVYLEQALEMLKVKREFIECEYLRPMKKVVEKEVKDDIIVEKHEANAKKYDWFDVDDEEGAVCLEEDLSVLDINDDAEPETESETAPEVAPEVKPDVKKFGFDLNHNPLEDLEVRDSPPLEVEQNNLTEIDKENQARYFYFYQADDGQQVFLNSLNVRMLNASWGALVAAPEIIKGKVLHRDTVSLGEQTRKHMPYTAHLPLHCSFDVVELDLKPPFVTPAAIENFAAELERRARNRARQERDERRRERAYHRAMEGPPKPDFSSEILFPTPPSPFGSPPLNEPSVFDQPGPSAAAHVEQPVPSTSGSSGVSFAKMAGTSGTWRVRKTAAPPAPQPKDDDEEDGHVPSSLNLSDAIEAALQASLSPSNKKNKKSKQKILFATGMNRSP
ncbi:RING finger protein 10 [Colias croceus]|uniref:RING finger protein 10 n=1 Tax=Colias crocea TaxID=72248 RepID=UPI001E27DE43|nr:RING finger protein 10 [Colias croceus]